MNVRKKFYECPDCGCLSVYQKWGQIPGEDGYACRTRGCDFFAFIGGNDASDVENRERLRFLNPNGSEVYGRIS